jgi:CHAT domain-containing protein
VMRLKLNADLVTLSACRTGLGKLLNGEGMVGLTRAFFYAGAKSVVVSLWNVNDIATASLMKSFYKHLQQGKSKEVALQLAKLELLKGAQRAWRHPYYWAAFVLVGEHL